MRNTFGGAEEDLSIFDDLFDEIEDVEIDDDLFDAGFQSVDDDHDPDPDSNDVNDNADALELEDFNDDNDDSNEGELDLVSTILLQKGIDPEKVFYEDEEGNVVEYNFYDLSQEDQLAILSPQDTDLSDHESEVIEYLRTNEISFEDTIEYFSRKAVENYIRSSYTQNLTIDGFDDEELFKLDLKSRFEDLTEEEIELQFQNELEHKDLFDKKLKALRQDYIEAEAAQLEEIEKQRQDDMEEEFEALSTDLVEIASKIEDIGGLELSVENKNEVLDFILNRDVNGVSKFAKELNNNQNVFKLAWFLLKGDEAFDILHDYYKKQIETSRKPQSTRSNTTKVVKKSTVVGNTKQQNNQTSNPKAVVANPFATNDVLDSF